MSALSHVFNTAVFTAEELAVIQDMLDKGQVQNIMQLLPGVDFTPEKEVEIDKLKKFYAISVPGYSDDEIRKKWRGVNIESQEDEDRFQKELNAHKHAWMLARGYTPTRGLPAAPEKVVEDTPKEPKEPPAKEEKKSKEESVADAPPKKKRAYTKRKKAADTDEG